MLRAAALALLLSACGRVNKPGLVVDFEDRDLSRWSLPEPKDWAIDLEGGNHFLRLARKGQIGDPRRPLQYALRTDVCVGDFDLRVRARRFGKSLLITFGYQDTMHFYYAHISSDSGDHAVHNGLFKVDGGERFRIAGKGSAAVLPEAGWQEVRLTRRVGTGEMALYAGADPQPRFRHTDAAFRFGRIGLGSFDETGDFDDLRLEGQASSECR